MIKKLFPGLLVLTALLNSPSAFAETAPQATPADAAPEVLLPPEFEVLPEPLPASSLPEPMVAYEVVQPIPPPPTPEEDLHYMTLVIYFEGRTDEPEEGLQAIASVVLNRTRSPFFPDTIKGVVTQGANGQTTGSCQFSFACDQYPEDKELLCQLRPDDLARHWGENACVKRWETYTALAKKFLQNRQDNTGKALMYYAAWMRKPPYWHIDLVKDSRVQRGSHLFFRSKRFVEATPVAVTEPPVSATQSAQMR